MTVRAHGERVGRKRAAYGTFVVHAAVACLFLLAGCKLLKGLAGRGEEIRLRSVDAKWIEVGKDKLGVEHGNKGSVARQVLLDGLEKDGRFRLEGGASGGKMDLVVTVLDKRPGPEGGEDEDGDEAAGGREDAGEDDEWYVEMVCVLKYRGKEGWPLSAAVVLRAKDRDELEPPAASVKSVVPELVGSVAGQIGLLGAEPAELRKALLEDDDQIVTLAVQLLGEKRDEESVPALCRLLDDSPPGDPRRDELMGALQKIGDSRASPCLIRAFSGAEPYQEIQIIRALSSTGGREAELFLEAVASGHEFEPVRELAREALEEKFEAGIRDSEF